MRRTPSARRSRTDAVGVNTIAQQLLRSEAIASSQIEGIDVPGHRALAKAAASNQHKLGAQLVLANIDAVRWVYDWAASSGDPFSPVVICEIHRRLATADRHLSAHAVQIRTRQNWIGRDPYTPVGADFIPPPAREVQSLLQDLCAYANRNDVAPVIQAATVHAQFETIHPFADGNGRVGRSLIGAVLARRQICRDVIPPVSLVLSRDRAAYINALTTWRFETDGYRQWIAELATACEAAALASTRLAGQVSDLQDRWREAAGHPRRDSAAAAIIDALPAYPNTRRRLGGRPHGPQRGRRAASAQQPHRQRRTRTGDRRQTQPDVGKRRTVLAHRRDGTRAQRGTMRPGRNPITTLTTWTAPVSSTRERSAWRGWGELGLVEHRDQ